MRRNRLLLCAAGAGTFATLASAMPAFASQLVTTVGAELVGNVPTLHIEQGATVPLNVNLSATGAIACESSGTASVPNFMMNAAGVLSPGAVTGTAVSFSGTGPQNGGSDNCDIDGGGTSVASLTVDPATPAGTYTNLAIKGIIIPGPGKTAKLNDDTPLRITVIVSEVTPLPPQNHAPTVKTAALNAIGYEGDTLSASGEFTDLDRGDHLTLTASPATVGTFTDNGNGTWNWALPTNDDIAPDTITVTADDGHEGTATNSFNFSAANVAPVLSPLTISTDNCSPTLGFSFTDAGSADTHTATINWGDGSNVETLDPVTSPVSPSHSFVNAGSYTVAVSVADDNGGTDTGETQPHTVFNIPSGILQPINLTGRSAFKLGSTIPVKITVANCEGAPVGGLNPQVTVAKKDSLPDGSEQETVSTASPTSGTRMRWDATSQHYIYNLGTKGLSVGDWIVSVDDDTFAAPVTATLSIKK